MDYENEHRLEDLQIHFLPDFLSHSQLDCHSQQDCHFQRDCH